MVGIRNRYGVTVGLALATFAGAFLLRPVFPGVLVLVVPTATGAGLVALRRLDRLSLSSPLVLFVCAYVTGQLGASFAVGDTATVGETLVFAMIAGLVWAAYRHPWLFLQWMLGPSADAGRTGLGRSSDAERTRFRRSSVGPRPVSSRRTLSDERDDDAEGEATEDSERKQ